MNQFCTCFGSQDLFRGLALYNSLQRHAPGSTLWVLCLDRETEKLLEPLALPDLRPVTLATLEAAEPRLAMAQHDRSHDEYEFTCWPAFIWHLLTREPAEGPVTAVGPELYFFSSLAQVLEESLNGSVGILAHRYPPRLKRFAATGLYDVSWMTFTNDRSGRECAAWWRNRCFDDVRRGSGTRAGRKLLDDWPTRFSGVRVIAHEGAGVAPWNVSAHPITLGNGGPRAGSAPLVFFHFHAFRRLTAWLFDPGLSRYGAALTPELRRGVYLPYLAELRGVVRDLSATTTRLPYGWGRAKGGGMGDFVKMMFRGQLVTDAPA